MPPATSTRDRIMEAVRLQIEANGVEFSLGHALLDAGVSRGSFAHFFPSKLDAIAAVLRPMLEEQCRFIPSKRDELDPGADLIAWSDSLFQLLSRSVGLASCLISSAVDPGAMLYPFTLQLAQSLEKCLGPVRDAGLISSEVTTHNALLVIIAAAMMSDTCYNNYEDVPSEKRVEASKSFATVFVNGLSP